MALLTVVILGSLAILLAARIIAKGLACVGERHYQHKLRASDIPVIRGLRGKELQRVTASRYGVSKSLIGLIQARRVWRHVASDQGASE